MAKLQSSCESNKCCRNKDKSVACWHSLSVWKLLIGSAGCYLFVCAPPWLTGWQCCQHLQYVWMSTLGHFLQLVYPEHNLNLKCLWVYIVNSDLLISILNQHIGLGSSAQWFSCLWVLCLLPDLNSFLYFLRLLMIEPGSTCDSFENMFHTIPHFSVFSKDSLIFFCLCNLWKLYRYVYI